tara:strand:- start:1223 stop:1606 length:384 start_codon:yes stop_codon:yes gene_type:complete
MIINTPISLGELIDKISILQIKHEKINDLKKKKIIANELQLLQDILHNNIDKELYESFLNKLITINKKLWSIEDDLRMHEKNKKFDDNFVELARSVYYSNDERAKIKLEINNKFGSKIIEVKSYEKY